MQMKKYYAIRAKHKFSIFVSILSLNIKQNHNRLYVAEIPN